MGIYTQAGVVYGIYIPDHHVFYEGMEDPYEETMQQYGVMYVFVGNMMSNYGTGTVYYDNPKSRLVIFNDAHEDYGVYALAENEVSRTLGKGMLSLAEDTGMEPQLYGYSQVG